MICADTSSLVALLDGELGGDVDLVRQALRDRLLCISPISVTELLSDPDPTFSRGVGRQDTAIRNPSGILGACRKAPGKNVAPPSPGEGCGHPDCAKLPRPRGAPGYPRPGFFLFSEVRRLARFGNWRSPAMTGAGYHMPCYT